MSTKLLEEMVQIYSMTENTKCLVFHTEFMKKYFRCSCENEKNN